MFGYFKRRKEVKDKLRKEELVSIATSMAEKMLEEKVNLDKERKRLEAERIKEIEKQRHEAEEEEQRLAKVALKSYTEKKKASDVPWMEIIQEDITPDGVKITLDWNDAQIKFLRANGYNDPNDEVIIHQYMSSISRNLTLTEIAQDYVDSGKELSYPAVGDFSEEDEELDAYVRDGE